MASDGGRVERIGHRGAPREFPENSLPAFARAFERGANAVELDVHATADGVVVVHHDAQISRSAKAFPNRAIAELTHKQIKSVELDYQVGIPTLTEVLAVLPRRARAYVEIKGVGIEAQVATVLARTRCDCAVHSFDHAAIAR